MTIEDNDIRVTLGAVHNAVRDLGDKLDDIGALASRAARLGEVVDAAEAALAALPDMLRDMAGNLHRDPSGMGILLAPHVQGVADELASFIERWRAERAAPPAIEKG